MPKVKLVCPHCGSDDITRDGLLRWSVPDQKWEASSELDNMDCNACGEEISDAKEVEVDAVIEPTETAEEPDRPAPDKVEVVLSASRGWRARLN